MSIELERLTVQLEAQTVKFEKALAKAMGATDARAKQIEQRIGAIAPNVSNGLLSFAGGLGKGLLAGLALDKIAAGVRGAVADLAELKDVADAVGFTTDQLQALRFAVSQSGGDFATADKAIEKFTNNVGELSQGQGFLYKLLKANGVAISDSNGELRSGADLLAEVANLIQAAATPQERFNLAVEIFGRKSGRAMVNALIDGAAGLNRFGQEAAATGAILKKETIDRAGEIDDAWTKMTDSVSLKLKGLAVDGVAALDEYAKKSVIAAKMNDGLALSVEELTYAIELAKKAGSPIDPAWLQQLDDLTAKTTSVKTALANIAAIDGLKPDGSPASPVPVPPARPNMFSTPATRGKTIIPRNPNADKDELTRALDQSRQRTQALQLEASMLGKSTYEQERARTAQELTNAAKEAGLPITADLTAKIDKQAASYAAAAATLEDARQKQAQINDQMQLAGDLLLDGVSGVISGTESLNDALANTASRIAEVVLQATLLGQGPLAGLFGAAAPASGGLGGLLGSLIPRADGGPVSPGKRYLVGERGPEVLTFPRSGIITPNTAVAARASGGITFAPSTTIDARGSQMGEAQMRQILAENNRQLLRQVPAAVEAARGRQISSNRT